MDHFHYHNDELYAEQVSVASIAQKYGTPCYIYSRATLEHHWRVFDEAFSGLNHRICFAVKANSNIAVLNILARAGAAFDIVSGGELTRVIHAKGDPKKVIFSGIGKSETEIAYALRQGVGCFNIESRQELHRIDHIARNLGKKATISLRINPDIAAGVHPYITTGSKDNKFGIAISEAVALYEEAKQLANIQIRGIAFHIGSQHDDLAPFQKALQEILKLIDQLQERGITISLLDIGGGMGVRYQAEEPPAPSAYGDIVRAAVGDRDLEIIVEPGRAIAANAGILVTAVEYLKHTAHRDFAIVDAGMNDLIRPALYEAWHEIIPVRKNNSATIHEYDIVGPVCESGDFLAKRRHLALNPGDLLAVRTAGAYGFVMSSNYNTRPRAVEVMVDHNHHYLIRRRETLENLLSLERLVP